MKVMGLIGGCGTGKSEVASILQKSHHAHIIIADRIGHELLLKGMPAYDRIVEYFGKDILAIDGEINRKLLGDIVFNNDQELEKLNNLMHPLMYDRINQCIVEITESKQYDFIVIEAAVMIEAHFIDLVDTLWLVTCPMEQRIERLMTYRNMPLDKIEMIISKQKTEEEYKKYANVIINNGLDLAHTSLQIQKEIDKILEEYHEK